MSKKSLILGLIALAVVVAVFAVFGMRQTEEESEPGVYDEFAQCLYANGMRMYGSVTCSFCERQRKLFGNSFEYIQEIECDPRNDDHEAELCIEKKVSHTPTWIFEDEEGNDLHRFDAGMVSLEELSQVSGCTL